MLVVGEPGMGKTRLAGEALEDRRRASIELSARAHPLGDTASFGLWVEALERHLRTLAKPDVAALCGGFLDDLASLLRSVAVVRGAAPEREPPRPRLLEGLWPSSSPTWPSRRRWSSSSTTSIWPTPPRGTPSTTWPAASPPSGSSSWPRPGPGSWPSTPWPSGCCSTWSRSERSTGSTSARCRPTPSGNWPRRSSEAAAEPELIDWLGSRAQGNPLFVLGLLQALVEEGGDLSRPALRSLPEGLAERVRVRMDRLDDSQRGVMEVLAVAGGRVELATSSSSATGPWRNSARPSRPSSGPGSCPRPSGAAPSPTRSPTPSSRRRSTRASSVPGGSSSTARSAGCC